ncbi:MAG: hypothetical protein EOL97_15410, partial [Spirochaetia bacterium]|nr:hypothetical protein [Spirochaetia bacterium]
MDNLRNIAKKAVSLVASLAMVAVMLPVGVVSAATVSNGDVIKAPTTDALYLIQDGQKRVFPYVTVYYSWGFTDDWANEVTNVDQTTFDAFPTGEPLNFRDGYIFRATESAVPGYESEAVFLVSEGKIRPFHSAAAYEKMVNNGASNDWSKVTWVPDDFLMKFQFQPGNVIDESYVDAGNLPNGMLVSPESSNTVYLVSNGKLRAFATDAALAANGYDPAMVVEVSDSRIAIQQNGVNVTGQEPALKTPGYVGTPVTPEEPTSDLTVSAVSSNG